MFIVWVRKRNQKAEISISKIDKDYKCSIYKYKYINVVATPEANIPCYPDD